MVLEHIQISGFRNISQASVEFSPKTNVLVGDNAQGKTNLVEAVYLMAGGKSFRVSKFREMIRQGEETARIQLQISGEGLPFALSMQLNRKEGKEIKKNGVRLTKLSDFLGLFRAVLFCPEHLSLVKDGPAKRRSFIDGAICQIRPYYASLLNEAKRLEEQRAALLKKSIKEPVPAELFAVWEERLATISVKVACLRADYIARLSRLAPLHFSAISANKEKFCLQYESDVFREGMSPESMTLQYLELLRQGRENDRKYGFTQKGIHRDDLLMFVSDFPARGFASQGQQRSAVLSLKLAEGEISREMTGQEPVYLLDDVLSELDEGRRRYITEGLVGKQVILTGTDPEDFSFVDRQITVKEGAFFR
jgi:DNA replication and repair protein RecF